MEGSFSRQERENFKELIFSNVVPSTRVVLEAMETLEIPLDDERLKYHVQTNFMQPVYMEVNCLPKEVGNALVALKNDEVFKACLARRKEYQIADNVDL